MTESECLHKPCRCPARKDADYCSDACHAADQSHPQGASCACGHAACRAEAAKDVTPATP